uniref:Tetraspanin n=1 Tax=Dendroctonus ponderosae TaxID=77166 RepID=A0AAR5QFX1_DENPD
MGCSEGLARIFVFVTNFAFLLVGLALLVVGILYKVNYTKYTEAIPDDLSSIQYVPTIAIVVGAVIFFIAFLGCCGTLKSNTCMLTWYGAILIVIFLVQVGLGVFALLQVKNETELQAQVENQLTTIFGKNDTELINLIQLNVSTLWRVRDHLRFFSETVPVLRHNWSKLLGAGVHSQELLLHSGRHTVSKWMC